MSKEQFLEDRCVPGMTLLGSGQPIKFYIEYGCDDKDRDNDMLRKVVYAPMRMVACDRRFPGPAELSNYMGAVQRCLPGYGLLDVAGQPNSVVVPDGESTSPMVCVETR